MFDTYGTLKIDNKDVEIDKLSIEELKKYYDLLEDKERALIEEQNEYLSQLLG